MSSFRVLLGTKDNWLVDCCRSEAGAKQARSSGLLFTPSTGSERMRTCSIQFAVVLCVHIEGARPCDVTSIGQHHCNGRDCRNAG